MKEKMNSKEIEKYFKERLNNNKQNLDKINDLSTFDYFNDSEIEGYPWWGEWKEKLAELDQENLILGENYQKTKLEEDYEKYSKSDKQLQDLKIRIDEDVTKYKTAYKEKLVENLSEDIKDFREAVEYNLSLIDKELKRLTDRRDLLLKEKDNLRASYKGEDYDAFFYEKINKLFGKINQLEDEKKALINLERDLDITEFEKLVEENTPEPVKPEPIGPEPVNPEPVNPEPVNPDPVKPDPVNPEPVNPDPEEDRDIYSNSYDKSFNEYEMLLEAYKEDLEKLYELQEKFENNNIEYSEYEKHADYMVERYSDIKKEYDKLFDRYNRERKLENPFVDISNEDLAKQLEASGRRLKELKGYDEQYADERANYTKIVEEIEARKKNPLRVVSTEQLELDKADLKKQLEASGRRLKELKGYDEQYADERANYSDIVEKLTKLEKELSTRLREPEKPEQPMMILEKEKEEIPLTEDYIKAINEEYAYRKQDMVDKFMGNRKKAKEYDERLDRFKSHIVEKEFNFIDENGNKSIGKYKTIEEYNEYEKDVFFLQLEEYKNRLENMSKYNAGDKSIYKDKKIGDRIITAQEQLDDDTEYVKTYNYAYNSHVHTQNNLMTLGNYGDKLPYSKFKQNQPIRNSGRALFNVLKFIRNWTIAPVSRVVGKRIVAPVHRVIYKPEESNPNPYKARMTHRYEQRKNYFAEKGKGYIASSFAAMFNYKEGNRATLAARGGEIYESIENKYIQKAQKEIEVQQVSNKINEIKLDIDNIKNQLENPKNENEKEILDKKLADLVKQHSDLQKDRYDILNERIDQTVQTDSVDTKTHDRTNKRNITRAVTLVKALAVGAVRYCGPKIHKYIIDKNKTEVITWTKGEDTLFCTRRYMKGNYEDVTVGDFMQDDVTTTYAVNNVTPHNITVNPEVARGFAVKIDGAPGDGYASFIDGNGMTDAEIFRIADARVPEHLLNASGNLDSSVRLVDLAKEVGISINSKADMEKFINNLEICMAESGVGIGHKAGWVGKLIDKLNISLTDGYWRTITKVIPGKMQKVVTYTENETLKKILGAVEKGTDAMIIGDVADQIYQNLRQTESKGKAFNLNRKYEFDDKGKTKGPEGFDYDRKGRNKNTDTDKSFVPTYSQEVLNVLKVQSVEELKEKLAGINKDELSKDELHALKLKRKELENKVKKQDENLEENENKTKEENIEQK